MSIAGCPVAADGADPPDWLNNLVPVAMPEVTRETSIPSIDDSFRFVLLNALSKLPTVILSKKLAGKLVREEQLSQD